MLHSYSDIGPVWCFEVMTYCTVHIGLLFGVNEKLLTQHILGPVSISC